MVKHFVDTREKLEALHYNSSIIKPGDVLEITGEIDITGHDGQVGLMLPGTVEKPVTVTGGGTITGPGLRIIGTHVSVSNLTLVGATWGGKTSWRKGQGTASSGQGRLINQERKAETCWCTCNPFTRSFSRNRDSSSPGRACHNVLYGGLS